MTPPPVLDAPKAPKTRRVKRPIRRTPGTVLGFLAAGAAAVVVVLGLAAGLYVFQDAYKAGHQSNPKDSADAYLDAVLNKRSMDFATTYLCGGAAVRGQTEKIISGIKRFEKANTGSTVKYIWTGFHQVSRTDSTATLTTQVTASTSVNDSVINNPAQTWTFTMRNESGWKVCGLRVPE